MQRHCLLLFRGLRSSANSLQAAKTKSGSTPDPGSKAILYSILTDTSVPLNSAQIWEQAEKAGIRSKRHTKHLLHSMRKAGAVQTKPMGKNENFVYALRDKKVKAASETPSPEVTQGLH